MNRWIGFLVAPLLPALLLCATTQPALAEERTCRGSIRGVRKIGVPGYKASWLTRQDGVSGRNQPLTSSFSALSVR